MTRFFGGLMRLCLPLLFLSVVGGTASAQEQRIVLKQEMLLNETAVGDSAGLVDEQEAVGDPASGKGLRPQHPFFPGWTAWEYPVHVMVDLGAPIKVTRIFLYNESGESPLVVSTGEPFAWKDHAVKLGGYQNWREFPLNVTTRYLRLTLTQPTSLPELVVYADGALPAPHVRTMNVLRTRAMPTMDTFIGTNAFIDDPVDKLTVPVGFVREYHNWSWDTEGPDHQVRFQPSGAAGGHLWFFDDFYAALQKDGVTVCPAIQQTSPVYFPGDESEAKPLAKGADPEDPASYVRHAAHLYQFAARYGSMPVGGDRIDIAADQPRRTGLNTVHYVEDWNEPDKNWRGRAGRFDPYELAAMCSADRDGDHQHAGKTLGVRIADPRAKLVMGGLVSVGPHLDYLRAMKLWADVHRGGDFPADVINLHHYSGDGDDAQAFKTTGISPEADHVREKLAAVTAWRDANMPAKEVWVTEFGYDTDPRSPLHAPAIGVYSAREVQAIWLVRYYMALAAAGVDKAAMFMFRDTNSSGGGVFETSGMVTEKGQWKPKPSYFYITTLKRRLAHMFFAGEIASGRDDVRIYRFSSSGRFAYVVWCPTSTDHRVSGIVLPWKTKSATRVDFADGQLDGVASPLTVAAGKVTVEAREQPILVME